jgi:hypothetical protein
MNGLQLDRLVDGELGEAERASLLGALDREPDGWKRCAMAFLEAQAWREAAAGGGMRLTPPAPPARSPVLRQLVAIAAVVAVAFCVGFVSRDAVQTGSQHPTELARRPTQTPDATTPGAVARAQASIPPAVPESLRLRMEREGYRVEGDRRVVPVALGDGRKVALPVDTVSLRYVGQRVY